MFPGNKDKIQPEVFVCIVLLREAEHQWEVASLHK